MGSRIKKNPDKTFYCFFQAACPIARDKEDPDVLFQFPEDFSDEESLQSLPRFCFPYDIARVKESVMVQHFTFVLTDLEGDQRFGFCRLTSSSEMCMCILSYLPWFEVFYKLLNNLADYSARGQMMEMKQLLSALYHLPVPPANGSIMLPMGGKFMIEGEMLEKGHTHKGEESVGIPFFIAPDPKALPSIPESRNLTELVVAVDVGNLLQLYASLLFERRILIYCSKLSTLTACVHACSGMLFPMFWQHIFIPVLPPHLLDYCCAPMPYLIGIHSSLAEKARTHALEDVVLLNIDSNSLESPHNDLKRIPANVVSWLKLHLKRQAAASGSGVARAFLRAQALLFGGYRDAIHMSADGAPVFSNKSFINHKSASMREFLEGAVHLQCFKEFIDWRLETLQRGEEPDDVFEEELLLCGASSGGSKLCREWMGNLKKGGGALIVTWKSTANKATKYHGKFGLKSLLSSKDPSESHLLQRGGSMCGYRLIQSDCLQSRLPITQHFGKSRPRRPACKHPRRPEKQHQEVVSDGSNGGGPSQSSGSTDSPRHQQDLDDEGEEDEGFSLLAEAEEMDLLGEIFDTLSARSSREPATLYASQSLDTFSNEHSSFISRKGLINPSQESLSCSVGNSGSLMSWEEEEVEPAILITGSESEFELGELDEDLTPLGESLRSLEDLSADAEDGEALWTALEGEMNSASEEHQDTQDQKEQKAMYFGSDETGNKETERSLGVQENIDEPQEESVESPSPKVSSVVALFKSKAPSGSSDPRRQELSQKSLSVSFTIGSAKVKLDEEQLRSPEALEQAPVKVSELKKRFEQ